MRVLIISNLFPRNYNPVCGIFVARQALELARQGVEVRVLSPTPLALFPVSRLSRKWREYAAVPAREEWEGLPVYNPRFLSFPRNILKAASGLSLSLSLGSLIKKIHAEFPFDLIHAHTALPDGDAAIRLAREYGLPGVVTVHGADLQQTVHLGRASSDRIGRCFREAGAVVFVSRKLLDLALSRYPGQGENYHIIHNGVDPARVSRQEKAPGTGRIILSVSNLIPSKGLEYNLRALAELGHKGIEAGYKIIGDGPGQEPLGRLAKELGIDNRVEFLGRLPHAVVMDHLAQCDVFSLPSYAEGFGVVYLEAMAHGKPVIACRGEGIDGVVEHGKTGWLVAPRDLPSLTEALEFLLTHRGRGRELGEAARDLVLKDFTWEKSGARCLELYKQLWAAGEGRA